jgi:uncharacterized protein with PIN domain
MHCGAAQHVRADAAADQDLDMGVLPATLDSVQRVAEAYGPWDKGVHPAALNLGDCFAYELAKEQPAVCFMLAAISP